MTFVKNSLFRYVDVLLICLAIVTVSMATQNYLEKTASAMVGDLQNIERLIKDGDWDKSIEEFSGLLNMWHSVGKNWALIIDHMEIDNLNIRFARIEKLLSSKDLCNAAAEIGESVMLLKHLPEREKLSWQNIL